jgi:tetratricopeptide (TPR) repeat protein
LVLQALGDLPRAKELLERALASALQNLGEDHPSVATSRSNLAAVLRALGDLPRAKELLERALASDLQNLGEDHHSVATNRSNLAMVLNGPRRPAAGQGAVGASDRRGAEEARGRAPERHHVSRESRRGREAHERGGRGAGGANGVEGAEDDRDP